MDKLCPSLVESIAKRSSTETDGTSNRWSSLRGFQNVTQRLDTTTRREDIKEKVNLDGLVWMVEWGLYLSMLGSI